MRIEVPMKIPSIANLNWHWTKKHKLKKLQRGILKLYLNGQSLEGTKIIRLTRVAPRQLDPDNLVSSFKYIVDAIADMINPGLAPGQADRNLTFVFDQEKGKPERLILII